jgi:RNA polymerase sigma-70 factor (ECF subfamily)
VTRIEAIDPFISPVSRHPNVELDSAFEAARPRLVRIATSLVGPTSAEDVVHDTYLAARRSIRQLHDPGAVEAWLARICVHRAFRIQRRGRRLRELLDRIPRPVLGGAPRAAAVELRELIEALPPRERAVIVLQHGHGYSLVEVAELVGVSHANARQISSRARAKLLRGWQEAER